MVVKPHERAASLADDEMVWAAWRHAEERIKSLSITYGDLGKHFQSLLNLAIQHKYAQCQQIQLATMYGGLRLRGGETGRCLAERQEAGDSITEALETCNGQMTSLTSPLGVKAGEVNLLSEALEAVGANAETRALAADVVGEVTLKANGSLLTQSERPSQSALLARFERHKTSARSALQAAAQEYRDTGTVTPETLREASSPSQPLPLVAVEALAAFKDDPVRGPVFTEKLSTAQALERLTWECHDLQAQLEAATEDNPRLSDGERALLRNRYEAVQRELLKIAQKVDVRDKHVQPAFDDLLREYTAVQSVATKAGLQAPMRSTPPMPFRTQSPGGYSR